MLNPGRMNGNDPDTIRFMADAQAIAVAVATARRFAEHHGLSPDTTAKLAIIVEELVTNLVDHGGAPGCPIELALQPAADAVRIALSDGGACFDPRDAVASPLPPERGGGAGIALVLAWARVTGYRREGARNRLDLLLPLEAEPGT